ncbi:Uncharacterized protein TCAP_03368 [Tolypocladium capitatum]|uniref:DOMON domain-containing protein n=1 Tax=Tolypocladium capitatum TaxID=45235 RepID=A0A2K3QGM7_9HYPO|nr:Uncharacterized protein TCAP_03368 [Tolypocladium capitatum]
MGPVSFSSHHIASPRVLLHGVDDTIQTMRLTAKTATAVAIATNVARVSCATSSYCPASDVCFQWGVPEAAARSGSGSGSGNVYFQLKAPTTYEWVGLGIGTQMRGADMFVMYASGNNNVTLSTRRGVGHVMPLHVQRNDVELLEGSGISDGQMTANVRCGACTELNLAGPTGWLAAWLQGSPLNSESTSATISVHEAYNLFSVDLAKASIGSDANPFLTTQGNNTGGSGNGNGNGVTDNGGLPNQTLAYAHGILMTLVFVVGYPIGSVMMPLIGNWIIHASWQMLVFLGMWAGFGIGYVMANRAGWFFINTHTQLGVFVCALMGLQPVFGWLHHVYYVKHRGRGIISHIHIWYGRALIIIGIVNGGLGLQLAGTPQRFCTAYIAVASLSTLMYVSAFVFGFFKNRRSRMGDPSPGMSDRSGAKEQQVSA